MIFFAYDREDYADGSGFYYEYEDLARALFARPPKRSSSRFVLPTNSFDPSRVKAFPR